MIMIGEIRDQETAMIATEASLTGHLVLSTLHTNDASTAVVRLQEMGVPTYLITSTLELVVAQRLARRLCPRCKKTVDVQQVDMPGGDKGAPGSGCNEHCTSGRMQDLLQHRVQWQGGTVRSPAHQS